MEVVYKMTLDEIKDKYKEAYGEDWSWALGNTLDVNDKPLDSYDDDDEFYTDGRFHFVPFDEVKDCIEWEDALIYIIENGEYKDFMEEWFNTLVERAVKSCRAISITEKELQKMYIDYVSENADLFFEWLWEQKKER